MSSSSKLALLIASPHGNLRGPINDAARMEIMLNKRGFKVSKICGNDATRVNIIQAWKAIVSECESTTALVIFYAGHGGTLESTDVGAERKRYQYLVPMDYDHDPESEFRGILDVEISHLMRLSTNATKNVTIILDCCFSGRMARDPEYADMAVVRSLEEVRRLNIESFIHGLRSTGQLGDEAYRYETPAVRITASSQTQKAYEMHGKGLLTEALVEVLGQSIGQKLTWRATMPRVADIVKRYYPQQHPRAEGPDRRLHFSAEEGPEGLHLYKENGTFVLQGGRITGIERDDVYAIMPHGSEGVQTHLLLGEATVVKVEALRAYVQVKSLDPSTTTLENGGVAFVIREASKRDPLIFPRDIPGFEQEITQSKFLRPFDPAESIGSALSIVRQDGRLVLRTSSGTDITSHEWTGKAASVSTLGNIIQSAEQLIRAKRLLALSPSKLETFDHEVEVTFRRVDNDVVGDVLSMSGDSPIMEGEHGDHISIHLSNKGAVPAYVTAFQINAAGKIFLISYSDSDGERVGSGETVILGGEHFDPGEIRCMSIKWPSGVPRRAEIPERFVFVITNKPVDLRYLETSARFHNNRTVQSSLESLANQIATGETRDPAWGARQQSAVRFGIIQASFLLQSAEAESGTSSFTRAVELPELECTGEWQTLLSQSQRLEGSERGLYSAIQRAGKGVPPHVRVVNQHTEEITVVSSKSRPVRFLSGVDINASATGGGLSFNTSAYTYPATKKTLPPGAEAIFPLWSRTEDCAVISIFKGTTMALFVENDMVPAGATAYFTNNPDLRIVSFKKAAEKREKTSDS